MTTTEAVFTLFTEPLFAGDGATISESPPNLEPTTLNTATFDVVWHPVSGLLPSAWIQGCRGAETSMFGANSNRRLEDGTRQRRLRSFSV